MPVGQFDSFQGYDASIAIGLQSGYGQAAESKAALVAREVQVDVHNQIVAAHGTTGSRGIITNHRTRGARYAEVSFSFELWDTAAVASIMEWILGSKNTTRNDIKLATLEVAHTGGDGIELRDVAARSATLLFRQGETATGTVKAVCLTDWDSGLTAEASIPSSGTPLLIDDLSMSWNSVELPFLSVAIAIDQMILPVFANNAFPVSYNVPQPRIVDVTVTYPPADTTFNLLRSFREDETSDLVITSHLGDFSVTLKNAKIDPASFPAYDEGAIQPLMVRFMGASDDAVGGEVEVSVGGG